MKFDQPTKAQKEWREWARQNPVDLTGGGVIQIHHPIGRKAQMFGVNIGHWFVLGCTDGGHRILEKSSIITQRQLFAELCATYHQRFYSLPFDVTVFCGIMNYSKTGRIAA